MYNANMEQNQVFSVIKNFLGNYSSEKPLLVLLGPTASGKTALSLELAKQYNGEIISADSRQVYRFMDIGTDKIPPGKREGIPHHLIDVVNPNERFTVADFKRLAEEKIDDILRRGKLPMLAGGTGLYIEVVTKNFSLPPENQKIRAELFEELNKDGAEALFERLKTVDPETASKISPQNIPYLIRALEIYHITGHPKNDQRNPPRYHCLKVGLNPPRELLFQRILERVDAQIKNGLLEETKNLLAKGYARTLPSMRSLGYSEMSAHLEGEISLEEAAELLKRNTRNFAKRQMVWFKRDVEIIWFASAHENS